MRKILLMFFLFSSSILTIYADEEINIISRQDWGANETYRYIDSPEWLKIIKNREEAAKEELSEAQKEKIKKTSEMNKILTEDFYDEVSLVQTINEENGHKLAWPIGKTKNVKAIVVHHTYSDFTNSVVGMRSMYKYHSLTLGRGDIGYNYLIGKDGEIFEGRAGGDYTVAGHNKWNNRSTVGIALIGDYTTKAINEKQYQTLEKLTRFLVKKYSINLDEQTYYHKECFGDKCEKALLSYKLETITGHRDAAYTTCPGDALYKQITQIKTKLQNDVDFKKSIINRKTKDVELNINKESFFKKLEKVDDNQLLELLLEMENILSKERNTIKYIKIEKLKNLIIEYFDVNQKKTLSEKEKYYDDTHKIKIKLSYPNKDSISLKSGDKNYRIIRDGKHLKLGKEKVLFFKLSALEDSYVEISSWDRTPSWDRDNRYNDNKFRGDIILYVKNNTIQVVNRLTINDYLKGLGEVSNTNETEKIKTIIISARTYARWYTTKARKFEGKWYDGSDNPDEFQKYIGYEYEIRSPLVSKIVEKTKDQVITYDGELIKPWYFSQSNGETLSYYKYCINSKKTNLTLKNIDQCKKQSKNYPFLKSVKDPAGEGKQKYGHGVGISGLGATYFANIGWRAEMIIKYYLKGVKIELKSD